MAYKATLSVAGNEVDVYEFYVSLQQANDNRGRPASGVFTGDIFMILEGGNDLFFEWLCDQTRMESGKITTKQTDQDSTFVEYAFEKSFLTDISESFYDDGGGLQNQFNDVSVNEDGSNMNMIFANRIRGRDSDTYFYRNAHVKVRDFQRRTRTAYCTYFSLSCEKIRIRDVEHNNVWGR